MQHVTSFTMFDSYHVGLFTTQTRDFEKIQDGPQSVKRCIAILTYDQVICKDSHTHHIKSGSKSNTNSQLQSQFSHRI